MGYLEEEEGYFSAAMPSSGMGTGVGSMRRGSGAVRSRVIIGWELVVLGWLVDRWSL